MLEKMELSECSTLLGTTITQYIVIQFRKQHNIWYRKAPNLVLFYFPERKRVMNE